METLTTVLASLDELGPRIADLERLTSSLEAQIERAVLQPRSDDKVALGLAYMALASLRNQRRTLLAKIEELRGNAG